MTAKDNNSKQLQFEHESSTTIKVRYTIPEYPDGFKQQLEKWLQENIPVAVSRIIDNFFEEDLLEMYDGDFEGEPDSLDEIGEFDIQIVQK